MEAPGPAADQEHQDDVRSIRAVRDGQTEAFGELVARHAPALHRVLRRFFRDDADVDDLLQEAFVRAYRSLHRYDATRPFFPWLRRIAVNAALNELQRRKTRNEVDDAEVALSHLADGSRSDDALEQGELVGAVDRALENIPPAWAAVFRLRTYEELSYAEIADTLDVPIGTVMSRLARARTRLAEALAERFGRRQEDPKR